MLAYLMFTPNIVCHILLVQLRLRIISERVRRGLLLVFSIQSSTTEKYTYFYMALILK